MNIISKENNMTDAVEDAIDREEEWEWLIIQHKKGLCDPSICPFCNLTYGYELFR